VSANATAGFSVVTYTGNGTVGATIGHGLGVTPSMFICKDRSASATNWPVYHQSIGNTGGVYLNDTTSVVTSSAFFNNTSPTSTVFSVGNNIANNKSGDAYVAYCFAAIAGYSAFGSYTGNGSSDGPFVYCGFRPRYVLFKRSDSGAYDWVVLDTSRDPINATYHRLLPDTSGAEDTGVNPVLDFLSNGFKIRTSNNVANASGGTYIYAAFAENPFQNSLAR
jgi:hypothetical protein